MSRKWGRSKGSSTRETEKAPGLDCPTPTKTAWQNRKDARRALRNVKTKISKGKTGRPQVYLCVCQAFHIGHSSYKHRKFMVEEAPPLEEK